MESFIAISVNAQNTNMLCVVGTHVTRYGSSSGVDGLEQESLLKFGVEIEIGVDIEDPLLQEAFLESLKKTTSFLETSPKDFNNLGLLHKKQ